MRFSFIRTALGSDVPSHDASSRVPPLEDQASLFAQAGAIDAQ